MKNNYHKKILCNHNIWALALLVLLSAGNWRASAQNTCAAATPITAGTYTIDAINGAIIPMTCAQNNNASLAEWYVYTPTQNYSVTVSSDLPENVCKDTNFTVYTGTCAGLACYTRDDDSGNVTCPNNSQTYLSTKTFDVIAGTSYYIAWDNKWMAQGFKFKLTEAPFVPSPCYTATPVTAGLHTVASINGNNVATMCSNAAQAKWYAYTPTQDYRVTISSDLQQNLCKDTNFSVYTGSCSGTLTCVTNDDNGGTLACNSGNTNSNLSKRTFEAVGGTTYYIAWDNKWSADGFDFEITEQVIVVPVQFTTQNIATINSTYNMCVVDMNGDGFDDIVGVSNNTLKVHYQLAGGVYTVGTFNVPGTSKMPGWSLAAGDLNKDGYNDLLLGAGNGLSLWISSANGTAYSSYNPGDYIFCQRTNFIDINNDGNLDAFSCHDIAPNCYYMNDGAGNYTFYQSTVTPGSYSLGAVGGNYATIWADLDNDGDQDMFVSKCSGPPCEIHRNDGTSYTNISGMAGINVTPIDSWSSAVFDFDNDGDMDILIGSNGDINSKLFRNNLDTTNEFEEAYTDISAGSGWDTDETINKDYVAYDFDNDGYQDILSAANRIMFNQAGSGTFIKTDYTGLSVGPVGDLNNDGFLDIQNGATIKYGVPNGNKWFVVRLKGVQSNSNGIGARVELYGPWGKQIRDIRAGEGFSYASTLNAHFGLGQATTIEKVIIKWPSGVVDTILNPTVNQRLFVVEGSTLGSEGFAYNNFSVYPNPADDVLNIQLGSNVSGIVAAEVYDLNGRLVAQPALDGNAVSVKQLSAGTYLLVLNTVDGKRSAQKFIKK